MECIKFGSVSTTTTVSLGQTIPVTDYIVKLDQKSGVHLSNAFDSNGYFQGAYEDSYAYISAKTTTSFTINCNSKVTYQVIKLN